MTELQRIPLSRDGSAWIKIGLLDVEHRSYILENFENMFDKHPEERAQVALGTTHTNRYVHRWQQSYGKTPVFDNEVPESYMFAKREEDHKCISQSLPSMFCPLQQQAESLTNQTYNQFVVNWYLDGNDYIAMHSDYCKNRKPESSIVVVNLSLLGDDEDVKSNEVLRHFTLKRKLHARRNVICSTFKTPLLNGTIIEMGGKTQELYRHGVTKVTDGQPGPRISLTLRNYI